MNTPTCCTPPNGSVPRLHSPEADAPDGGRIDWQGRVCPREATLALEGPLRLLGEFYRVSAVKHRHITTTLATGDRLRQGEGRRFFLWWKGPPMPRMAVRTRTGRG